VERSTLEMKSGKVFENECVECRQIWNSVGNEEMYCFQCKQKLLGLLRGRIQKVVDWLDQSFTAKIDVEFNDDANCPVGSLEIGSRDDWGEEGPLDFEAFEKSIDGAELEITQLFPHENRLVFVLYASEPFAEMDHR